MQNLTALLFLMLPFVLNSQHNAQLLQACDDILEERGEVYVRFDRQSSTVQEELYSILSFDHGSNAETSLAYISAARFDSFVAMDIPFDIVADYYDRIDGIKMMSETELLQRTGSCLKTTWDFYPTYEAYVGMMNQFATTFPELCEMHSLGTLSSGREILALKITGDVSAEADKPKFLYTSTMHGDETAGFPLLLRLSDYLLCQYDEQDRIKEIVDNVEIWINPLANPDGTYRNDNSTITGATRGNANNADLNRNFPDPEDGLHPDGMEYQEETLIFMDFAEREQFNLSSNFHGGVEVFNYPWDTFSDLPADVEWWICMGRMYADTVHVHAPSGYFDFLENGVTNGYEWYEVRGGRQDYMIYNFGGREFTLELSDQKILNADELVDNWEYNYRSLINFLAEAHNGLRGVITDSESGEPIVAEVFIENHDERNSQVFSKMPYGSYYRYLASGTYTFTFTADEYKSQSLTLDIVKGQQTVQDVQLVPRSVSVEEVTDDGYKLWTDELSLYLDLTKEMIDPSITVYDLSGKVLLQQSIASKSSIIAKPDNLNHGVYVVVVESADYRGSTKLFL